MYSKYIVLKKTVAALPLQAGIAENNLKGEKAERSLLYPTSTPPPPVFIRGVPLFPNPPDLSCVKIEFFEIPVFPPTQTGRKKENSPNSELQTPRRTI